ncbi:MAG: GNAT family N-acetyltransferase [Cyanobacteria bacterium J06627_15]
MTGQLTFKPIDLAQHADLCVQFRRDAMACSFEDGAARFDRESGANGEQYLEWLKQRIVELPEGCVHLLEGDQVVGQIELQLRGQQTLGDVKLLYLIPSARGRGLGEALHDYVIQVFQQVGVVKAQLSVSPTNERAVVFYQRHGWQSLGARPDLPEVTLMELTVPES